MSRYIDEISARENFQDVLAYMGSEVKQMLKKVPPADVVEVVRCKDCKFWGIPHANDVEKSHYCCRDNMWCMPLRFADDFCSCGERKEE